MARTTEPSLAMPPADNDNGARGASERLLVTAAIALANEREATVALRLDPARHMRLRIACALGGRSARAILREALDAHLGAMPGIERLAAAAMVEGGEGAATAEGGDGAATEREPDR